MSFPAAVGLNLSKMGFGWSIGAEIAFIASQEQSFNQGKHSLMASMCQALQVQNLSYVVNELSDSMPTSIFQASVKVGTAYASRLGFFACPAFAFVKQGHFKEKTNPHAVSAFNYLANQGGNIAHYAILVSTCALNFFGNPYFAGAMLVPIAYQALDSKNLVPQKMSLFLENYLPTISSMITLISGSGPFGKAISLNQLLTNSPNANKSLQTKIDRISKDILKLEGASLEEIEAPLIHKKELSFEKLNAILECNDSSKFTINPSHCSKWAWNIDDMPKNSDFAQFLNLFEIVDWASKYSLLKNAFKDDDRFLEFLKTEFPGKEDYLENFEDYVATIAQKEHLTKELYLAKQLKTQMTELVKVFLGETRAAGSQKHIDEASMNSSCILPYLLKRNDEWYCIKSEIDAIALKIANKAGQESGIEKEQPSEELLNEILLQKNVELSLIKIEIEDALLKLAIEGGEYCGLGVKRTSREILDGILHEMKGNDMEPQELYECQLRQTFEFARKKIMYAKYQKIIENVVLLSQLKPPNRNEEVTDQHAVAIAQNVHIKEIYYYLFGLGFIPLTHYERNEIGILELMLWETSPYRIARQEMYREYQDGLSEQILELGNIRFFEYIRHAILKNTKLDEMEQNALIEKWTERNGDAWSAEDTDARFHRLGCVILGILNYDSIGDDWIEASHALEAEEEFSDWEKIESEI